jgi:hypothetical protein
VTFLNPDFPARANQSISSLFSGHSVPNLLFIQQHNGFNVPITSYGRPLQINFSFPMSDVKMAFETSYDDLITMTAYSPDGNVLDSTRVQGFRGDPLHLLPRVGPIELYNAAGVGRVELYSRFGTDSITGRAENFGIDDLDLTPVPEPSTIALLALGSLGLLARRRFASKIVH